MPRRDGRDGSGARGRRGGRARFKRGAFAPRVSLVASPPPPPAPAAGTIAFKAYRQDDFASATVRAVGPVWLPPTGPQRVTAADVPNATVWTADGLTQLPAYVADPGARHAGVASDALLYVEVEVNATFASLADEPGFLLRFDVPRTTTPLLRQGQDPYVNPLDLGFDATGKQWRLNTAVTVCHGEEDVPRRVLPQDIVWMATPTLTGGTTGVNYRFALCVGTDGVVRAFQNGSGAGSPANGSFTDTNFYYPWYLNNTTAATRYQPFIAANIHVAAGQTVVIGTDVLNGNAAATVTVTGGTKTPASLMLDNAPRACLVASDPAYLVTTQFCGAELLTATDVRALGTQYQAVVDKALDASNIYWFLGGPKAWSDSGGATAYNYPLTEAVLFCMSGQTRYMRRAYGYGYEVHANLAANSYTAQEQQHDVGSCLVWISLTGNRATSILAGISKGAWWGERSQIAHGTGNTDYASGSGRFGLHAVIALYWAERLGLQLDNTTQIPGATAAYTLAIPYDDSMWPSATSWRTAVGNKQRFLRLLDRYVNYMTTEPAQPANAGLRFLRLNDYDYQSPSWGVGPFMQGHLFTSFFYGMRTFGVVPATGIAMIRDGQNALVNGVSHYTGQPFLPAGANAFVYNTPGGYLKAEAVALLAAGMTTPTDTSIALDNINAHNGNGQFLPTAYGQQEIELSYNGQYAWYYHYGTTLTDAATGAGTLDNLTFVAGVQQAWPAGTRVRRAGGGYATGANLNGFHLPSFWWLLQQDSDAKWRTLGDAFFQQMAGSDIRFNHKEGAELGRDAFCYLAERMKANVPGYTGVLNAGTLSASSATLLTRTSGGNDTQTLSVTALRDRFGDPLSLTGATIAWSSLTPAVASVDPSLGTVSAVSAGAATVRASVTKGGVTITIDCAVTVRAEVLNETFSVNGALDATKWTGSTSGAGASQTVTGGALVQTTQDVSFAQFTQKDPYNFTGGQIAAYLSGFTTNINCLQDFVVCDAAGVGILCRLSGGNLYVYAATAGTSTPATVGTAFNGGTALGGATTLAWRVSHNAATGTLTVESSTNGGTSWTARASNVTVPGFDPSTARMRGYARIAGNGVGPFTTSWDRLTAN